MNWDTQKLKGTDKISNPSLASEQSHKGKEGRNGTQSAPRTEHWRWPGGRCDNSRALSEGPAQELIQENLPAAKQSRQVLSLLQDVCENSLYWLMAWY